MACARHLRVSPPALPQAELFSADRRREAIKNSKEAWNARLEAKVAFSKAQQFEMQLESTRADLSATRIQLKKLEVRLGACVRACNALTLARPL